MRKSDAEREGRVSYRLLSLLISAGLLAAGIVILHTHIDWGQVTAIWSNFDSTLVMLAATAYWLQYPINSFRLHRVILWASERPLASPPTFGVLFRLTCCAGFVTVAAPVGLAGDAARIVALRAFGYLSITEAARSAVFDRVVGVQWICLIGLTTLPFQAASGIEREALLAQFVLFTGLIGVIGVLLVLPGVAASVRSAFVAKIARVFVGYRAMLGLERSAVQLAIALLNLVAAWSTLYLLLRAAGLSVNPWLVAMLMPLLQLVNSLPFLYLGWGGREIAMAATLGAASNLAVNETLAVSIAWGVILIMTGAVNGVFLLGDWQATRRVS